MCKVKQRRSLSDMLVPVPILAPSEEWRERILGVVGRCAPASPEVGFSGIRDETLTLLQAWFPEACNLEVSRRKTVAMLDHDLRLLSVPLSCQTFEKSRFGITVLLTFSAQLTTMEVSQGYG